MNIDPALLKKADSQLRNALRESAGTDELRVVAVVGSGAEDAEEGATGRGRSDPGGFVDRRTHRARLIERRKKELRTSLSATLERLTSLGLKPRGGQIGHVVVLDGTASAIAEALAIPELRKIALDQPLDMNGPRRRMRRAKSSG